MHVTLRAARPADLAAVGHLLAACKLAPNAYDRQFGPGFAVATDDSGQIVGVAGVERYGEVGLFRSAAVDPSLQGMGIGARLTLDRIDWARGQGLGALYLLTETAADYWPRFGFTRIVREAAPTGVRESAEWAGGCPASAVAMVLDLTAPTGAGSPPT